MKTLIFIFIVLVLLFFMKYKNKLHFSQNIVYYKGGKYDITEFISQHPGGSVIKKAIGKDLETIWKKFGVEWHLNNSNVMKQLEKYKIS